MLNTCGTLLRLLCAAASFFAFGLRNFARQMAAAAQRLCKICGPGLRWSLRFLRRHGGKILYYGCVTVVLVAAAVAAEAYRRPETAGQDALLLPEVQAVEETEAMAQEPKQEKLQMYDHAEILRGYSDEPVYNRALMQWEAHPALDLALEGDAPVTALAAGTIAAVYKSAIYGACVEIESGGLLYRYASLEPAENLEAGAHAEAGMLLGRAGTTLPAEADMGPHLHLEIYQNGRSIRFEEAAEGGNSIDD